MRRLSPILLTAAIWLLWAGSASAQTRITTTAIPDAVVGRQFSFAFSATGGFEPYDWYLVSENMPPGMTLSQSGILSGTPTQAGQRNLTIYVTDNPALVTPSNDTKVFSFTIHEQFAIVTPSPLPRGTVGLAYSQGLQATGGLPPYNWRVSGGQLPPGLQLLNDGRINGTPTTAGTYNFEAVATDSGNGIVTRWYTLTVMTALAITTPSPLPSGTLHTTYSKMLEAVGGLPPYSWRIISGQLPPGLQLFTGGRIYGKPTETGVYNFQIELRDDDASVVTRWFALSVFTALRITTPSPLPEGTVGDSYSLALQASGGQPPYTWSRIEGSIPPGLTLTPKGVLSGKPTSAGSYRFQVRARDAAQNAAEKLFDVTINVAPLTIVTTSLPNAEGGTAYSQTLEAKGGVPPYQWSLAAGDLPSGMTLNDGGVLSGTPGESGDFGFWVKVTDSAGKSANGELKLTVTPPALPGASIEGLPPQTNPAEQEVFTVELTEPYPLPLTGTATLTFAPDAAAPVDDPAVQFTSGGRSADFTVPVGETQAVFSIPEIAVQTGSVAGTITVALRLFSGAQEVTPSPQPVQEIVVARAAPVISSVQIVRTGSGFEVHVVGLSTTREMVRADFTFTAAAGANLQTRQATVQVGGAFSSWYGNTDSAEFGSNFAYTQPFTISGNSNAVASVSVTLTNSEGTSSPVAANF